MPHARAAIDRPQTSLDEAVGRFPDAAADPLSICGYDGRIKWVNPAHERVTGFSSEELVGKPYIEFVHPQERERALLLAGRLAAPGSSASSFEARLLSKDGSYREFLVTAAPSEEEELIYVVAKDASCFRRLDADSARFMDLSLDLFLIVDFDGYWRRVNPAVERTLGYSWDELCLLYTSPSPRD